MCGAIPSSAAATADTGLRSNGSPRAGADPPICGDSRRVRGSASPARAIISGCSRDARNICWSPAASASPRSVRWHWRSEARAPFRLLYAARNRDELAFAAELAAGIGDRLELFVGEEGRRIDLAAAIDRLAKRGVLYVCGPFGMLEAARRHWQSSGRPMDGLHFETFGSGGRLPTEPFLVKIPRLGKEIRVPKHESMLEAMERAGIEVIADCRRGECGLCALTVLQADGPIDHRDVFFSDRQKRDGTKLCACVSRLAGGSITIDTADRTA